MTAGAVISKLDVAWRFNVIIKLVTMSSFASIHGAALAAALATIASAFVLTPMLRVAANRLQILDHPQGYKAHHGATPLLGGVAIVASILVGLSTAASMFDVGNALTVNSFALFAGIVVIASAGLMDDIRSIPPLRKLSWQLIATACSGAVLLAFGDRRYPFALLLGHPVLIMMSVVWVLTVVNAINFLDNMNGACAGMSAIAAAFLGFHHLQGETPWLAIIGFGLSGACIGFLPFNWPLGRIFLGDSGSMAIGFTLAFITATGVLGASDSSALQSVLAPLLILAIPLADTVVVVVLRIVSGCRPWHGDRRHITHRLVKRGLSPAHAVATLWLAGIVCGFAGVLLPGLTPGEIAFALLGIVALVGALFALAGTRGLP